MSASGANRAPSPALMKAWLIAHPTCLTGTSANDNLPSSSQGYGRPNLTSMFDETPKVLFDRSEIFDNSGEMRTYTWGIVDPSRPLRTTMGYTDAPGALNSSSPQVNHLDLNVTIGGQTYLGNHFTHEYSTTGGTADTSNDYEAVFLPARTTGDVTITVTATNMAGDGVPNVGDATDQDFALICSTCSQAPSFTLSAPDHTAQVCSGTDYGATVNIGSIQSFADPVVLALSGEPTSSTAAVAPTTVNSGDTATVWVTGNLADRSVRRPAATGEGNLLAGKQAWCGDPQASSNLLIDLSAFAGQTFQFRFRLANDGTVAHASPGWAIDDVKVAGCATNCVSRAAPLVRRRSDFFGPPRE